MPDNAWAMTDRVPKYPHFAMPHPRAIFWFAVDWWRHWLAGEDRGQQSFRSFAYLLARAPIPGASGIGTAMDRWQRPAALRDDC